MNLTSIARPEYYLRPGQIVKRILSDYCSKSRRDIVLPGGLKINVSSNDELGKAITYTGIYDLCLTEALWRFTKRGDVCIDAGANIGYASAILACLAGKSGHVTAFEPHPEIFRELNKNVSEWNQKPDKAEIFCINRGLSDYSGDRALNIPPDFIINRGMAHFYEADEKPEITSGEISVSCITLDEYAELNNIKRINLLKIDVEGHEIQVLKGAKVLLKEKRIVNIIFEDSRSYWTTPRTLYNDYRFLTDAGYTVLRLKRGLLGPAFDKLEDLKDNDHFYWRFWEPPNFIATLNPDKAIAVLSRHGWYSILNKEFK